MKIRHVLCATDFSEFSARALEHAAMGAHSRKPLERLFVGSTTQHVLRLAPCPVLTVRMPDGK